MLERASIAHPSNISQKRVNQIIDKFWFIKTVSKY
jgi:hypothetical protein